MGVALSSEASGFARVRAGLQLSRDLAARLDEAGIRYCHFKSNQHLEEGLLGITDLDVLVDRRAGTELARILDELDFKRFSAPPAGDYPGVEDHLGFDAPSGRLIHLHLHFRLIVGERHLKGYRLPWEDLVLSTSREDRATGFRVSDPDVECLLLLVKSALKLGATERVLSWLGRGATGTNETREFAWLMERVDRDRLMSLGATLLGERAQPALRAILTHGLSPRRLLALREQSRPVLDRYRRYPRVEATARRWWRMAIRGLVSWARKRSNPPMTVSRTDPRGGVVVAFVGADGSGKSTLTRRVVAWLGWKLDARAVYFGSGEGPSSLLRLPLRWMFRRARAAHDKKGNALPFRDSVPSTAKAIWALVLAFEKRRRLTQVWRARNRGQIVFCDRYPQHQIMGFTDG
ncbi:MAG TPA: hypothetical protein VGR66_00620, partial [Candidatus Eisenbacteria bacterium]|nr:hypothetical protein [Candidatus Eisenbacteria bacterium]